MASLDTSNSLRPPVRWRRIQSLALAGLLGFLVPIAAQDQPVISLEHQVKIAFLYHFARFVEWPKSTFPSPDAPVVLGILGNDVFYAEIESTLGGKVVDLHPLVIRRFRNVEQAHGSQILFIGGSPPTDLARVLDTLSRLPVLTVGDGDRFTTLGGMIGFRMEDNKVRFEINVDAAERSGLKLSSKLLSVARIVHGGAEGSH